MEEIDFTHNSDGEHTDHDEETEGGLLSKKLVSLVLGAIVLVLVIAGGIYAFTRTNVKQAAKKQVAKVSQTQEKTATATPGQQQINTPKVNTPINGTLNAKTYTDSTFGYSVKLPNDWEAFVRAGDTTAQQIAIHPVGSADVPVTINSQINDAGISTDEFITMQYGSDYPREQRSLAGRNVLFVRNDANGYVSYFVANGSSLYEIAVSTVKPEYNSAIDQIVKAFKFTTGAPKGGL